MAVLFCRWQGEEDRRRLKTESDQHPLSAVALSQSSRNQRKSVVSVSPHRGGCAIPKLRNLSQPIDSASPEAVARLDRLHPGEKLVACVEINNPTTCLAVQVQTCDYYMIGWTPRYLVGDLINAIARSPAKLEAKVVKVNPVPAPSKQRVLIEFRGQWPAGYEPMSGDDFDLLAG
jgi:hypothetical protein